MRPLAVGEFFPEFFEALFQVICLMTGKVPCNRYVEDRLRYRERSWVLFDHIVEACYGQIIVLKVHLSFGSIDNYSGAKFVGSEKSGKSRMLFSLPVQYNNGGGPRNGKFPEQIFLFFHINSKGDKPILANLHNFFIFPRGSIQLLAP